MSGYIPTEEFSIQLRDKSIDFDNKKLLVTNYLGTEQEKDLTVPPNCEGFGRIRHFKRETSKGWPENPLPIDPAVRALNLQNKEMIKAQVFQNSACNWRCWYCFVPFQLLNADSKYSEWKSASELVELYLNQENPPKIIDLTGGQPDLVPEWVPWMMAELKNRRLENDIFLWSDDNLSNDFFWRYLDQDDIDQVIQYKNYARVCCFKGFNKHSFSFNTKADPELFSLQFDLFDRFKKLGIDLYAYVTLTTPTTKNLQTDIKKFIDKLQRVSEFLPLRTIPLEIQIFTPVKKRLSEEKKRAINYQWDAVRIWKGELNKRFNEDLLKKNICDVPLN